MRVNTGDHEHGGDSPSVRSRPPHVVCAPQKDGVALNPNFAAHLPNVRLPFRRYSVKLTFVLGCPLHTCCGEGHLFALAPEGMSASIGNFHTALTCRGSAQRALSFSKPNEKHVPMRMGRIATAPLRVCTSGAAILDGLLIIFGATGPAIKWTPQGLCGVTESSRLLI